MQQLKLLLLLCLCSIFSQLQGQANEEKVTISGYIKNAETGEELLYASVLSLEEVSGATTNLYGFYSLSLPKGTHTLQFSYLGFETLEKIVNLQENLEFNIELLPSGVALKEVVVEGRAADQAVKETAMSRIEMDIEQIKKMPALLGEPDIIKSIQLLPGVTSAGEGSSSFFVRGGSADQNLVLIDEAPVYDVSHVFGIFSVFNADIIKSAELYKGGIPAKHGGRLSSLLEVTTRDGNSRKLAASGGIGLLASRLAVEGPIVKDKASFIIAGRRSYVDLLMKLNENTKDSKVAFHDLNAKINWKGSNKDRFFLAAYSGRDNWEFDGGSFGFGWGNRTATFRWNHLFSERLFSNTSLIYSNFDYKLSDNDPIEGFAWTANQEEFSIKEDLSFFINPTIDLQFGYHGTYRRFLPGLITPNSGEGIFQRTELAQNYALDHALYLGANHELSPRLSLQYGARLSVFQNIGERTVYTYENAKENNNIVITDSTHYARFENIKTYYNIEPRFSARYLLNSTASLKFSYNRMAQYIHLVSNSTIPIPFNTWMPSGTYVEPQLADQVAIGYFKNFQNNTYEFSLEAYYKQSQNVTAFADNAQIFFNENLVTEFRQGEGESYGLELYLQKRKGYLQGSISYTLSRADMTIEGIENGQSFAANHDRRHALNAVATYELNEQWTFGAAFTYATGRPMSLPTGKYDFNGYQANLYSGRNAYRLPDFHRLDLSANWTPKKNANRRVKSNFAMGIYNAYNRSNAFTIYVQSARDEEGNVIGDGTQKEARLVSLFGTLPYFTWNFSF